MRDALMVNLGSANWPEKKGSWPRHIPVPLSNVSAPGVFTSIYLKLITSYYAHILLIAMLYFDRIIQSLKLTKQKYIYTWAFYGPIFVFCTRFLMLPFLLNLSFFIKHDEILSWPPTCPAMYEVMRSFGAIKTKTHLLFAFDARFRVCTLFGPRVRNVNTAYSRDVFKESEARKT